MRKETFQKGINVLCQSFPNRVIDLEIYWDMLNDLDDTKFLIAIKDICSTTRGIYPGTNLIAVIREIVLSGTYLLSGEAWKSVLKEIARIGSSGQPVFKDKITKNAVNCIGWRTICLSENIGVERAHFLKIYEQLEKQARSEETKPEECKQVNRENIGKINNLIKTLDNA
jgi:hypothetical protein